MTVHRTPPRPAFTLVEVLIVITILGLLMALLTVGIGKGMDAARQARITTDLSQLDSALVTYKQDRNDFPPTMFGIASPPVFNGTVLPAATYDQVRFNRHARLAFPRYRGGDPYTAFGNLVLQLNAQKVTAAAAKSPPPTVKRLNIYTLDAAESLVLWLGGISDDLGLLQNYSGSNRLIGFSSDPASPFGTISGTTLTYLQPKGPIYPFDPQRLVDRDDDGWLEYAVDFKGDKALMPGYAYFDGRGYIRDTNADGIADAVSTYAPTTAHGFAMPYASVARTTPASQPVSLIKWQNANKFQLVAAGLDGVFSDSAVLVPTVDNIERVFPGGLNYTEGDDDNLVNFTTSTLRTEMEKQ